MIQVFPRTLVPGGGGGGRVKRQTSRSVLVLT